MTYFNWLKKLSKRWGLPDDPSLQNDLLCGEEEVESVAPLRSLQALARYIDRVPNCRYLFTQEEDRTIWQTIQEDPQYAELKTKLGEHLRFYGDRGPEELKLETLGLHEEPHRLIALIHTCRHSTPASSPLNCRLW